MSHGGVIIGKPVSLAGGGVRSAVEDRAEHQDHTLKVSRAAPIPLEVPELEPALSLAEGEPQFPGIGNFIDGDIAEEKFQIVEVGGVGSAPVALDLVATQFCVLQMRRFNRPFPRSPG